MRLVAALVVAGVAIGAAAASVRTEARFKGQGAAVNSMIVNEREPAPSKAVAGHCIGRRLPKQVHAHAGAWGAAPERSRVHVLLLCMYFAM